jgi:uncharacterized protein (TIGR03000 family)
MYSVVLMAALATSSSAPEFCHGWGGCHGGWGHGGSGGGWCSGFYGSGWGYGYGCFGPCYGYSGPSGCYGGWCYGGYYSTGYAGCYGHGCYGYYTGWSCYGSWGASPYAVAGCYGNAYMPGCYGGGFGGMACAGGPGCYGGYSGYGVPAPGGTIIGPAPGAPGAPGAPSAAPATPLSPSGPGPEQTPEPRKKGEQQTRAKVRIEIPADAKLYVDGIQMKTGSSVRLFQTPDLSPNQTYYYDLKAEIVRNNQTFTESQQIMVRPGETASASFAGLEQKAAAAAAAPATAQR